MFRMYSFDVLMNLRSCGSISSKTVLVFPKNFLNFRSDTIEKQSIINLSSYIVCLFGFYGISTFVGYLTPNLF